MVGEEHMISSLTSIKDYLSANIVTSSRSPKMNALLNILLCTLAGKLLRPWLRSAPTSLAAAMQLLESFPGKEVFSASSYRLGFGMLRMNNVDGTEQYSSVTSYTNHPNYNGNAAGYPNDIAVLRLTSSMDTSSSAVGTVSLASGSYDYAGQTCTISGWGRLSGGGSTPNNLQKVDMTVLTNNDCSSRWSGISGATINTGHICIFESGRSACSGDSGGPLVCGNTLTGITSWGISSCSGSYPSVYTRVSYFYSWVQGQ
ncbi:chymotrypsin-like serine proteinase [Haliotis cracherodii]|uniref:chymotrypsin-like serine proteinase n=1 Tax=Haliotis cracherodii TaxID=6455 RepID=UPI0039E96165